MELVLVALVSFLVVTDRTFVAQVRNEFPVAVGVVLKMAELPQQYTFGFRIAWVELPHIGIEQVIEKQWAIPCTICSLCIDIKPATSFGFLVGHWRPTDGIGVGKVPRLSGFMFRAGWHREGLKVVFSPTKFKCILSAFHCVRNCFAH